MVNKPRSRVTLPAPSKGRPEPVGVRGERDGSRGGRRYGSVRQSHLINLILHTSEALHQSQPTDRHSTRSVSFDEGFGDVIRAFTLSTRH